MAAVAVAPTHRRAPTACNLPLTPASPPHPPTHTPHRPHWACRRAYRCVKANSCSRAAAFAAATLGCRVAQLQQEGHPATQACCCPPPRQLQRRLLPLPAASAPPARLRLRHLMLPPSHRRPPCPARSSTCWAALLAALRRKASLEMPRGQLQQRRRHPPRWICSAAWTSPLVLLLPPLSSPRSAV